MRSVDPFWHMRATNFAGVLREDAIVHWFCSIRGYVAFEKALVHWNDADFLSPLLQTPAEITIDRNFDVSRMEDVILAPTPKL